jgi:hypothetical protein
MTDAILTQSRAATLRARDSKFLTHTVIVGWNDKGKPIRKTVQYPRMWQLRTGDR